MPIYEYECRKCGHNFEELQKVSDKPLRKCPACGALQARRLVSAPQFRLKGTGWYETDFKQDKKKRLADSGDATDGGGGKDGTDKDGGDKTPKPDKAAGPDKPEKAAKPAAAGPKKPASGAAAGD